MSKGKILGIVWILIVLALAWWLYNLKPGFLKG